MKNNRWPFLFVYFVIALIVFIMSPGTSMAQNGSSGIEQEYFTKANQYIAGKKYEQAAVVLEELLANNPNPVSDLNLNKELVYRQLTHIYDDYLFRFDKALSYYEMYLDQFPEGDFAVTFQERVAYLNERRSEWEALRNFRKIQLEETDSPIKESLDKVETILSQNQNALIAPEMHIYLGNNYFETSQYQEAREHVEKYINSFDKASMLSTDKAMALKLYADILVKQQRFGKAIQALDQAMTLGSPEENFDFSLKKSDVIKQRNMLYGFVVSFLFYISLFILLIRIKFWQLFKFKDYFEELAAPLFLHVLLSLIPVLILKITKEPEVDLRFFFGLSVLSILSHISIRFLAPLSLGTGRLVLMCCMHMGAASFMTYYMTVYKPVNTIMQADIDPVASLFLKFIWSSIVATTLINTIYAFTFSKKRAEGGYMLPEIPGKY